MSNRPRPWTRALKVVLPVVILAAAAAAAMALVATRPEVERKPVPERAWTVSAITVAIEDVRPELTLLGEVVAGRSVELRPLVGGRVVEVGKNYVEGGIIHTGELLVAIDSFEYESAVTEREAQLVEAGARLVELEAENKGEKALLERDQEQLILAQRETKRRTALKKKGSGSEKALDDAQRSLGEMQQRIISRDQSIAQLSARIEQQRAVISQRRVALDRAMRDLDHARLVAPFDSFVTAPGTAVGKQVSVNDPVARLIDADWLETRFHVSNAEYARLVGSGGIAGRPATVVWRAQARDFSFQATIERTGSEVNAASGGVELYARIDGTGVDTVLRPGIFVEVLVPDQTYAGVVRLPDSALQGGDLVYVIIDGRLEPRKVEFVARVGDGILVRGALKDGERVAATTFAEVGPGVKVEVR